MVSERTNTRLTPIVPFTPRKASRSVKMPEKGKKTNLLNFCHFTVLIDMIFLSASGFRLRVFRSSLPQLRQSSLTYIHTSGDTHLDCAQLPSFLDCNGNILAFCLPPAATAVLDCRDREEVRRIHLPPSQRPPASATPTS